MGLFLKLSEEDEDKMIFYVSLRETGFKVQGHHFDDSPILKAMLISCLEQVVETLSGEMPKDIKSKERYDKDGNLIDTLVYGTQHAFNKKAN